MTQPTKLPARNMRSTAEEGGPQGGGAEIGETATGGGQRVVLSPKEAKQFGVSDTHMIWSKYE